MFKNIRTSRLRLFYHAVFQIECRAFEKGDLALFNRCHNFNRRLWDEIWSRGG